MPEFTIDYTQTEISRQRIWIIADTPEQALEIAESYDFDNSLTAEIDVIETTFSEFELFGDDGCPVAVASDALPVAITFEDGDTIEVVHRTATIAEAEDWIAVGKENNYLGAKDVDDGRYGIDAPEEMINP